MIYRPLGVVGLSHRSELVRPPPQVSPAVTMDKLQESWKLYMDECDRNISRDPPSTGECNVSLPRPHSFSLDCKNSQRRKCAAPPTNTPPTGVSLPLIGFYRNAHPHCVLTTGLVCNRTFDKYACWPDGLPNTTVSVSCPWYLPWHHRGKSPVPLVIAGVRHNLLEPCGERQQRVCTPVVVQHGSVYQECDANGQWVTVKNTSECDLTDLSQVRKLCSRPPRSPRTL